MGYAAILHMEQGVALGRILPIVMLGSLTAIVIAGLLNQLGKRYPHLTGEGSLMPSKQGDSNMNAVEKLVARWTSAPSPAARCWPSCCIW